MRKILISICSVVVVCTAHANTETIQWYVDGNLYDTTTCESGGDIILPTPPTKYGYTFAGWVPTYDLSILNKTINGDVYYAIVNTGTCYYRTSNMSSNSTQSCTNSNYSDLSAGKWKTEFSYGIVYGDSKCSTTVGSTQGKTGNPVDTAGKYCWCRATGFIPDGEDFMYDPAVSLWIFNNSRSSVSECVSLCARLCGDNVQGSSSLRSGLYGTN